MNRKLKRGIYQITDAGIALGILFLVLSVLVIPASVWTVNEYRNSVAAGQARTVQMAVNKYVYDNAVFLSEKATPVTPFTLDVPLLVNAGYLPPGYSAMNNFSAIYQTKIMQPEKGKFHVMTFLTGGAELSLSQARNIAIKIGATGGYIDGNTAKGALGAWSENLSAFGDFNPGSGHIVIAGFYLNGAVSNDYLYRKAIPGKPELNTMRTALNMGDNDIVDAGKINAAGNITGSETVQGRYIYPAQTVTIGGSCSPSGLIGKDDTGVPVPCVNGKWKKNSGSDVPVGTIAIWGAGSVPEGWLECNGQTFNVTTYRELAGKYPAGRVPDFRGLFLRGLDRGAGRDASPERAVLSYQDDSMQRIYGKMRTDGASDLATGPFKVLYRDGTSWSGGRGASSIFDFDSSRVTRTDKETRPKNTAVIYIIKAQ